MDHYAARHQLADVLALAQEQMADLAEVQRRRAELTGRATAADGTVEVTVDGRGVVATTTIDPAYLEDFDFADLGGFISQAAQTAARDVARRSAELLAPLTERRAQMPALSDVVPGAPDLRELFPASPDGRQGQHLDQDDGWDDEEPFSPTLRT